MPHIGIIAQTRLLASHHRVARSVLSDARRQTTKQRSYRYEAVPSRVPCQTIVQRACRKGRHVRSQKLSRSVRDEQRAAVFDADCRSVRRRLLQTRKILAPNKNGEMILGRLCPLLIELRKIQQRATESGRRYRALFCQIKAPKDTGFFAGPDAP